MNWEDGWFIAVCTSDRSALFSRLLETIPRHLEDFSTFPILIVIDDSRDLKEMQRNENYLLDFCKSNNLNYEYWNRNKRVGFCEKLVQKLPNYKASIDYLLSPNAHSIDVITTGQARNFAIIRSIGKPLLMMDDDCLLNPLEEEHYDPQTILNYSGRKVVLKKSFDDLHDSLKKSSVNPFFEHLNTLGKTIQVTPRDNKNKFKVGLTTNAIAGALNSRSMEWVFSLREEKEITTTSKFLDSLGDDDLELEQTCWSGQRFNEHSATIPYVGTTLCGISPLKLIPPMPPTGRNQDVILGAVTMYLYQTFETYQFGWGLPHLPRPVRKWRPLGEQLAPIYDNSSFLLILINQLKNCPFSSVEDRLHYLAMSLSRLGNQSDIKEKVKETLNFQHDFLIEFIQKNVTWEGVSCRYQVGCEKMIKAHKDRIKLIDTEYKEKAKLFIKFSESYSQALSDWPMIWKECKRYSQ